MRAGGGTESVEDRAGDAAEHAAHNPAVALTARAGLAARGVVYLVAAALIGQLALSRAGRAGAPGHQASPPGAVRALADATGGRVLLALLTISMLGVVLFNLIDGLTHHRREAPGPHRVNVGTALLNAALYLVFAAWTAATLLSAHPGRDSSGQAQQQDSTLTARLLKVSLGPVPTGRVLVGAIGLAVVGLGVGLGYVAVRLQFRDRFDGAAMPGWARRSLDPVGAVGGALRALSFVLVGRFITSAAVRFEPGKGQGLDGALRQLAGRPYGPALLVLVGAGFAIYAVYCTYEARWRPV